VPHVYFGLTTSLAYFTCAEDDNTIILWRFVVGWSMKTLWVNPNFMHPTTRGVQIRTLEMLRHLHRRHEIHYVAIQNRARPEGPTGADEYCTRAYPFPHRIPDKSSPSFWGQLATGLFSELPVAIGRFNPPGMGAFLERLIRQEGFDCAVVDHLAASAYFPDLAHAILFEHNVETLIWRRRVNYANDPLRCWYLRLQAERMFEYERRVSRAAGHVVTVSANDADEMRRLFGVTRVSDILPASISSISGPRLRPCHAILISSSSAPWTGFPM